MHMIDQRRENLIDRHTYVGKLPNGDAISHECDGRHMQPARADPAGRGPADEGGAVNRNDALRYQDMLLRQEIAVRSMMASLGMQQPPRWDQSKTEEPQRYCAVPTRKAPSEERHPCHCTNHLNARSW